MKIALAQLNYTVGALEKNKSKIINSIDRARKEKAELVVFSEFAISGTPGYELFNITSFLEACEDALIEIASHCDDISVLVGLPIRYESKTISAVAFIQNRHIVRYIGKQRVLNNYDFGYVHPSYGCELITIRENRIAVVVGDDMLDEQRFGDYADIVVNLGAHQYVKGMIKTRHEYLKAISYTIAKPIVAVNQLGCSGEVIYDGTSTVYNRHGRLTAYLRKFEEDFRVIDTANETEVEIPAHDHIENIYLAIKFGLKDYFEKNGFKKACLGLSGGVDSAVVLAMAAEALGAENIRVLMMPSQFSSEHSLHDAIKMADNLGVQYDVIPIEESYKVINESLLPILGGTKFNTTEENIQARIRMIMLMALSNKFGYILLNTSNKSEAAVGYDTLYGDSAGSIAILGDLYKVEVYALARYINRRITIIPENIISKEPSAELRPGQKDSDSLPPYEVLDAILVRFIEESQQVDEIIAAGFDDVMVRKVLEMIKHSEFKRYQACPSLRLSPRTFKSAYKLPLINHFLL